jgi:NAD(P)-dependent dehydrogenase (short-subunit alcohol dehydrogenase family)
MARLAGKKALITGGTTGIGFATAKRFLEEGAQVAISGQNQERLQEALSKLGNNAIGILADLSLASNVQTMIDQVKRDFGSLDILVANAGIVANETPIYSKLGMPAEAVQAMAAGLMAQIPMGRFGQADEVAKAILFLASDDSSFMLGEEIVVDGGWSKV